MDTARPTRMCRRHVASGVIGGRLFSVETAVCSRTPSTRRPALPESRPGSSTMLGVREARRGSTSRSRWPTTARWRIGAARDAGDAADLFDRSGRARDRSARRTSITASTSRPTDALTVERMDPRTTLTDIRLIDLDRGSAARTPSSTRLKGTLRTSRCGLRTAGSLMYSLTSIELFVRDLTIRRESRRSRPSRR